MKTKLKAWQISLLAIFAVMFAAIASIFSLKADTVDEEETPEELVDNWEISTVFYDSFVDARIMKDDGSYDETQCKTPLTEINWNEPDNGYSVLSPRIITVQINYKNLNTITSYNIGELKIAIPNLVYYNSSLENTAYNAQWTSSIIVGANDSTHTGYDWNFSTGTKPSTSQQIFTFTNAKTIEEKANFEGSIQIVYTITPNSETPEKFEDSCIHVYSKTLTATLSQAERILMDSNNIFLNYSRNYIHPWQYRNYNVRQTLSKISSYDNLASNPQDYIWVKCKYTEYADTLREYKSKYPYIRTIYETITFKTNIPKECIIFDENGNLVENIDSSSNTYVINYSICKFVSGPGEYATIYIGFPKSIYNLENNNLEQELTVDLYATYENKTEQEYFASDADPLNLAEFEFTYTGDLYGIRKTHYDSKEIIRYQDIINDWSHNTSFYVISTMTRYTGNPLTVKVGDDLLYATNNSGNYVKLNDNEYYFTSVGFPALLNSSGVRISSKYDCELWVRYEGDTEYTLYKTFKNGFQYFNFNKEQKVVGFYFIIHDMKEGISHHYHDSAFRATVAFYKTDIPETGKIYNFSYLQVFTKDSEGNLIFQNEPTIDSYSNLITQNEIATFDQNTYGTYMQRACAYANWAYYEVPQIANSVISFKKSSEIVQNATAEEFTGTFQIGTMISAPKEIFSINYFSDYDTSSYVDGFKFYDLLPAGMKLISSEEELINSLDIVSNRSNYSAISNGYKNLDNFTNAKIYNSEKQEISPKEFYSLVKENMILKIIENWNNTGRTKIEVEIDFSDMPLMFVTPSGYYQYNIGVSLSYRYSISYDSFLEYGNVFTNNNYSEFKTLSEYKTIGGAYNISSIVTDNGEYNLEEADINENVNLEEKLSKSSTTITIVSVISTHQDVTIFVKTNYNYYTTGIVDASCDSEYEYKLRVRTGSANITNLVIYTSIEEAQPKRTRWKGEFLDIDTTYAENKGYTVKVWYSENTTVGTLAEDTSWQVYNEATVDKSKVKSLAFQYLVETKDTTGINTDTIDPAVLPTNSLTYVLIKMKSPNNESETRLARMDCWTQWNAIDEFGQPVDFITGINSNIVKVALPNSVKTDDMPSISLRFTKEITEDEESFKNMNLNKADNQIFKIRLTNLTANDDGTYNQVTGLLSSNTGLIITQIPIGTYLLEELSDNYFDFVEFTDNNDPEIIIEDVTFERTDAGCIITVNEDLTENIEFNIKVTNEIEDERFFEDKDNKENLFSKNKIEADIEDPI